MKSEYILQTENLLGGYGSLEIVHGISLDVKRKEIVSVIGPNGSGKSTFIKIVYGLCKYFGGDVWYAPQDEPINIANMKGNELVKLGIAYVPQILNIFPNLTIKENLEMGGYTLASYELDDAIDNVFNTYPFLEERKSEKAHVLSGGQRQMLALGRALMISPKLVILDEPSAALQPLLVTQIMDLIRDLRDNGGLSVLMVEQNTKSALRIADRGYILAAGQIVHTDTAYELLHNTDLAGYYLGKKDKDIKEN